MTREEAKEFVKINEITFDIEKSVFGGTGVSINIADEFESREKAERFIEALKLLCS